MIKIPYGISDYRSLIEGKYFYQDRTSYIQSLENWGSRYLLYLRPRRFGKSLLLSTLHYYYGKQFKKDNVWNIELYGNGNSRRNDSRG